MRKREKMRNSDLIFFSLIIITLGITFFVVLTEISPSFLSFWWTILWTILIPFGLIKFLYMMEIRNKFIIKIVKWMESTNNPVDKWIEKFNK